MKIIFIGDIVGKPGRKAVKENLPKLISEHKPDLVIANVENLAGGNGATKKTLNEMISSGINVFTGGNHIFRNQEIFEEGYNLARPANYPKSAPGKEYVIYKTKNNKRVAIINLMGRIFIKDLLDCPFQKMNNILSEINNENPDAIIVDFHAEATSEKSALRWHFDGKATAILGTHTHIATCDASISEKGMFFVSDVGMTGPVDSVIGVMPESVMPRFLSAMPNKFIIAKGRTIFQGFILDIQEKKVQNFQRFEIFTP